MTSLKRVQARAASRAIVEQALARDATPTIEGVRLRALRVNRDPRGTLTELLRADWADVFGEELPFAQAYASVTVPGVARDEDHWHVHRLQTDRFVCLSGRIVVPLADARPGSPTRGRLMLVELAAGIDAPAALMVAIPPGVFHGLIATGPEPALLLNLPTRLYDASDEGRVAFADADVRFPAGAPFAYDAVRAYYGVPPVLAGLAEDRE